MKQLLLIPIFLNFSFLRCQEKLNAAILLEQWKEMAEQKMEEVRSERIVACDKEIFDIERDLKNLTISQYKKRDLQNSMSVLKKVKKQYEKVCKLDHIKIIFRYSENQTYHVPYCFYFQLETSSYYPFLWPLASTRYYAYSANEIWETFQELLPLLTSAGNINSPEVDVYVSRKRRITHNLKLFNLHQDDLYSASIVYIIPGKSPGAVDWSRKDKE